MWHSSCVAVTIYHLAKVVYCRYYSSERVYIAITNFCLYSSWLRAAKFPKEIIRFNNTILGVLPVDVDIPN
jgi:hypothetical protein